MANGIQGLLADPAANLALGLLSAGGPSTQPVSLGQGLAMGAQMASEREREALRNEALRQEMRSRQRREKALERLPGLLGERTMAQGPGTQVRSDDPLGVNVDVPGRRGMIPTTNTPEGQQELMGLLGQIAPEQVTASLLSPQQQQRAEPAPVRIARVLADPNESQEVKQSIREQLESRGMDEQLANMLKTLQIQQLQGELQSAEKEGERNEVEARISVLNADEALKEAVQINDRLRGTAGETGLGFNELRRMALGPLSLLVGAFGGDEQRARQVAADVQRFEQLTTREGLQALFSGQVNAGTLTDSKMTNYLRTKPGLNRLPETNAEILADMLQDNLDRATTLGIELPDRRATEQLIETLRSRGEDSEGPQVVDFNDLPE